MSAIGKYQVVKELERIDVSNHKRSYGSRRYETFGMPEGSHSPLRQKPTSDLPSPMIEAYNPPSGEQYRRLSREESVDKNFRRARESCERIANVLGLNPSVVPPEPFVRPSHSSPLRSAHEMPVSASTSMATVRVHFPYIYVEHGTPKFA